MPAPDVLLHTFLDGETMMLRVIWGGQVLQCALSLADITSLTATIEAWRRRTLHALVEGWTPAKADQRAAAINAREREILEDLRRQGEEDTP